MEIGNSGLGVKVMTDDQMEMLRKQISVYASLCESLVQMHKSISAQHHFPGMGVHSGPVLSYALNKIPSRQRWAPKPEQLQILESIFEQSNATPDRQKIKDITAQLTLHGPISETNVYNWFQNRRARSKRKHSTQLTPNTQESEVEPERAKEKKTKSDECQLDENLALMVSHMYFQSPEIGGIEQLIGKAEVSVSYGADWQMDPHDLIG